jgi:hypothetical protein
MGQKPDRRLGVLIRLYHRAYRGAVFAGKTVGECSCRQGPAVVLNAVSTGGHVIGVPLFPSHGKCGGHGVPGGFQRALIPIGRQTVAVQPAVNEKGVSVSRTGPFCARIGSRTLSHNSLKLIPAGHTTVQRSQLEQR